MVRITEVEWIFSNGKSSEEFATRLTRDVV
jgi:hypothetical protein